MILLFDHTITSTKSVSHLKSFARGLKLNVKDIRYEDGIASFELDNFTKSIALKKGAVETDEKTFVEQAVLAHKKTSMGSEGVSTTQGKKSSINGVSQNGKQKKEKRDAFFKQIWNDRLHRSEVSDTPLDYTFGKHMYFVFSHVVTKGAYPGLEFEPRNIVLMTREEHRLWENFRYKLKDSPGWRWVFELHDGLIREYWSGS